MRSCVGCGAEIQPGERERNRRKWCSESCRVRAWARKQEPTRVYAPRSAVRIADCAECQTVFCSPGSRPAATCSEPCRRRVSARKQRERYQAELDAVRARKRAYLQTPGGRATKRTQNQRRRALLLGATVAAVDAESVYERDGWVCGICGDGIDQAARFPAPESASLDHVIPLSLGGDHTPDNVRASHLYCNASRGNRVEGVGVDGWTRTCP